ncbi:hypothetical protein AB1Y20_010545 [Prymnesium parvum]|uniref:Uncharacterized protein n=1 Tax=Prymnesium parvum TaxID=97485 RepID=A0AB34IQ31_PRYPA
MAPHCSSHAEGSTHDQTFAPLPEGTDLTAGHTESVGNSIRHVERASPQPRTIARRTVDILDFDVASALDRPRETVHAVLKGALRLSNASVRYGSRLVGRGVLHGAGAVTSAASRIEQRLSERTYEVASGIREDVALQARRGRPAPLRAFAPRLTPLRCEQLLRSSLPLVRQVLNRQIFLMFHKKIGLPLGQRLDASGPPPLFDLHISHLNGIARPADLDTIISSLSIQMEGVQSLGLRRQRFRLARRSNAASANPSASEPHGPAINPSGGAKVEPPGATLQKAAHADGEEAVIDFRVTRASVTVIIDPEITAFTVRSRHSWTPSFRFKCRRLDIVTPARLWWHMHSGVLWCAFEDEPTIAYHGDVEMLGACGMALPLGQCVSTRLFPRLWQKVLRQNNVGDPIKFPLRMPVLTGNANVDPTDIPLATHEELQKIFTSLHMHDDDAALWEACLQDNRFML